MPSRSRQRWITDRLAALDELESAHKAVGGPGRGRRYATQQINQAYTVLLSSQFQGFCRELYAEAADHLVGHLAPPLPLMAVVREQFTVGLKLNHGNPSPGNLGADFGRLGFKLWNQLETHYPGTAARRHALVELNEWRNAIAHHDFDPTKLGGTTVALATVRRWRAACNGLSTTLDAVVGAQIQSLVGAAPW